jgi:hypothetical protein
MDNLGGKTAILLLDTWIGERRFDAESNDWDRSEIKTWLNGEFYNTVFNAQEKEAIVTSSEVSCRVFLLSRGEAERSFYFADKTDRIFKNTKGDTSCWWLRSPGGRDNWAALVYNNGSVDFDYISDDVDRSYAVRPALIVNLSSSLFTSSSSPYETLDKK